MQISYILSICAGFKGPPFCGPARCHACFAELALIMAGSLVTRNDGSGM